MEGKSKVFELDGSDEPIREIMGRPPRWIIRYGNTFFLFFFVIIIALSATIKYPETVNSSAVLISTNAPKPVVVNMSGKLVKLCVENNQNIKKGDIIGFVESLANHAQILNLSKTVDSISFFLRENDYENVIFQLSNTHMTLGELQQSYQVFQQACMEFKGYLSDGYYLKKKNILYNELGNLIEDRKKLGDQKKLQEEDLALTNKTFALNEELKNEKVISELEYRNEKSKLINKQLVLPKTLSSIINNDNSQNDKKKEILELENKISQQKTVFQSAVNTLKSQLDDWKKKYLIISPLDGNIVFSTFLQENQQLKANDVIGYINAGNIQFFVETHIPQLNFGKVETGQNVILKFQAYPFQEYGFVNGKVDYITQIATDSGYLSRIILPNGLTTISGKKIIYKDRLVAQAEIVTKDLTLLERFYYSIVSKASRK
ncbi:hypothetical protein [Chitinophaga sp. Cy-1792]|uniref:biotin/lipoyl-binding protein n=1 Tax=Chitinophaga sp. Cy-1792 TaxID=2608339 RepID=UPI00141DC791|nr:hypothetical protein [Chitinophaga sp. Cy-1792]NIG56555.1 hypothetical protein [Chitinophaga sp. Cy-1792]